MLLPLLLILLGIAEFGRVYSQQLSMQYAAREAARTLALQYDDPGITGGILDGLVDDTLASLLPPSVLDDLDASIVKCSTAVLGSQEASVDLEDDVPLNLPVLEGSSLGSITVRARAQMPCEG